jgi:hypothetical protein
MSHRWGESDVNDESAWVAGTLLVRRWEAMKREILLHKWYESERAGHDIGWDHAVVDWTLRFGAQFEKRIARTR